MTTPPIRTQPPDPEEWGVDNGLLLYYNGDEKVLTISEEVDGNKITTIIEFAFSGDTDIEEISMPDSIISIDARSFQNCVNLRYVDLSAGVTELKTRTFYGCTALTNVVLPKNLTSIGFGVFANCTSLEKIEISETVTEISDTAFDGCTNLIMYVKAGSYAEEYARTHGIPYVSEGSGATESPDTEEPSVSPTAKPSARPTPEETPTIPVEEDPLPYEIMNCTVIEDTVEVTIHQSSKAVAADLIFANYDANGRLVCLDVVDMPDTDEFKKVFNYQGGGFGIYIWDLQTLKPYARDYYNDNEN